MFNKKPFIFFQFAALLCIFILPIQAKAVFENDNESKKTENTASKGNLPDGIEDIITNLLLAVPQNKNIPDATALNTLLDFMTRPDNKSNDIRLTKREQGQGAFFHESLKISLQEYIRYTFDPNLPTEAIFPTVMRHTHWLPESQILKLDQPLWKKMNNFEAPLIIRGAEYEEITPDTFSGSYYNYILDRLIILTKYKDKIALISVSMQRKSSSVGLKGAIIGNDSGWNYIYTKKQGSTLKLAGWADTFMYDSASISIFYETSPKSQQMEMSTVKYLKAGWAKINMVEPKHIISGAKRFINGAKQVLESTSRPQPDDIIVKKQQLLAMDDATLREALAPYNTFVTTKATKEFGVTDNDCKEAVIDNKYSASLSRDNLISELLKQYVKSRVGIN